jgi:hypothetical protein
MNEQLNNIVIKCWKKYVESEEMSSDELYKLIAKEAYNLGIEAAAENAENIYYDQYGKQSSNPYVDAILNLKIK